MVIYMGVASGGTIAEQLMAHGMCEETPVGIVENGTLPNQKFVKGKLRNLSELIEKKEISAPAVIVIGKVVEQSNLRNVIIESGVYSDNEHGACWGEPSDSMKLNGTGG